MVLRLLLLLFLMSVGAIASAQDSNNLFKLNQKLGRGINLGNMFEAPNEAAWGNPYRPDYLRRIASLGFQHIRIPIKWDLPQRSQLQPPFTISPAFLSRIQEVVDEALRQNLYVVMNMHHHEELFTAPDQAKPRFLSQWEQIATHFRNYDDRLLFEVLNEPHGELTPERWNQYFAHALNAIRKTNPHRAVVMGLPLYGGVAGIAHVKLPDDPYLLISPHYYNPFPFTHQGAEWVGAASKSWLGTQWRGLEAERQEIKDEFEAILQFSKNNSIPVYVGEFGAYNKADLASRLRWSNFLARWFEEQGFSWAYWEFSAGFGIYDPTTDRYLQPLVDALLTAPLPPPTPEYGVTLYQSNFSTSLDGWNLYTQSSATASLQRLSGALQVTIDKASSEPWHVQLVRIPVSLTRGNLYKVSFRASASVPCGVSVNTGKATASYTAYSGTPSYILNQQEKDYVFVFEMTAATDPVARLVLNLGMNTAKISLTSVKIEELYTQITGLEHQESQVRIHPNPTSTEIYLSGLNNCVKVRLYTQSGYLLQSQDLNGEETLLLEVRPYPAGVYLIELEDQSSRKIHRFIKM